MQIVVHGQHIEVTEALRAYCEEKATRLGRHFDQPLDVRMQLSLDKPQHRAEGHITVAGGEYHADVCAETMYAAIDLLVDKLDRQLIKHKEKQVEQRRGDGLARLGSDD